MSELAKLFDATESRFVSIAPAHMQYEAEKGFAIQLLKNSDYLMKAANESPQSLQQAITNVAAIGLSLNPAEKLAYLIPRGVKISGRWVKRIYLEPSYIGMIRLATDSGSIEWAQAKCVYKSDIITDNGVDDKPTHTYNPFDKDRGEFVGVYCVAKTKSGDYLTTFMPDSEVQAIKARNESVKQGKKSTWDTDFNEMAKKAVIRRAFKTWPRTDERRMNLLAEAVEISNLNEGFEPVSTAPNITNYTNEQKEYFDQMIERSDALGMYLFSLSFDVTDATSEGAGIWTNLTHSFEKGTKGKYQKLVAELQDRGRGVVADYTNEISESLGNDDSHVIELLAEMDKQTIELVQDNLPTEMQGHFAFLANGAVINE